MEEKITITPEQRTTFGFDTTQAKTIESPKKAFSANDMIREMNRLINVESQLTAAHADQADCAKELVTLAQELEAQATICYGLAKRIEPFLNQSMSGKRKMSPKKDIALQIHEKMIQGVHVDRAFIQHMFADWNNSDIRNMLSLLQTLPNVQKRKEGKTLFLYV